MHHNESLHRSVVENLYDGVYYVDPSRTITYWNRGAERITGYCAAEVVGRRCMDGLLMHVDAKGEQLCHTICPLAETMRDGHLREAHIFLQHKDGHRHPVAVRAAPIHAPDGTVIGAVEIFSDDSEYVRERRRAEDLERAAMTDPLTGLANRRYVEMLVGHRLAELHQAGIPFGVLFADIDHFKRVNDEHGHNAGDAALKVVATTLAHTSRAHDVVGRWGGEEFVGVTAVSNAEQLAAQAERMRALVAASLVSHDGTEFSVTLSIGATLARPGETREKLITRADTLMYASKSAGRNRVMVDAGPV